MDLILNLHKPSGITSQQAVTRVKKILKVKKAGHTGTLDPLATGVMLVCLGEATKVSRFFLDMDKAYRATVKLGERTDTGDAEGRVVEISDCSAVTEESLREAVMSFRGVIEQTPPMYSAVKVDGQALYKLARKGLEVERKSRLVTIYEISASGFCLPCFELLVSCSKGTYIRTLCEDIGRKLGTGAHLTALQRLSVGRFRLEDALTFDDLTGRELLSDDRSVFTIDAALSEMPEIFFDEDEARRVGHGQRIATDITDLSGERRAMKLKGPDGGLLGIGCIDSGLIVVERNLNLQPESVKT